MADAWHSGRQALLQVWSEVPNLMDPACKVRLPGRPQQCSAPATRWGTHVAD